MAGTYAHLFKSHRFANKPQYNHQQTNLRKTQSRLTQQNGRISSTMRTPEHRPVHAHVCSWRPRAYTQNTSKVALGGHWERLGGERRGGASKNALDYE
jgi:hypothetical protein